MDYLSKNLTLFKMGLAEQRQRGNYKNKAAVTDRQ